MAQLKIFWTGTAIKQRNHIFEYWNERNKSTTYSKKLNISIKERLSLLKNHPNAGKRTDVAGVRIMSLGHYSILYKYDAHRIIIVAFWDNRQDPGKLLDFLIALMPK